MPTSRIQNGIVRRTGKYIIQILLRGHQLITLSLSLSLSLILEVPPRRRPTYLQELCVLALNRSVHGRSQLLSASTGCIQVHMLQTSIRQQSFAFSGPSAWNRLPPALCDYSLSPNTFKQQMITHLFGQ